MNTENKHATLIDRKDVEREFYERMYVEQLVPCMQEEKDYVQAFLLCYELVKHLPYAQRLWMYWAQTSDKLGMYKQAVRCSVIGLHLHPTHQPSIRFALQLMQQSSAKMADELRVRQYALSPVDFDLCFHYFSQMIHKKLFTDAFKFILNYLIRQYFLDVDVKMDNIVDLLSVAKQSTQKRPQKLGTHEISQFKAIAQQFVDAKKYTYAVHVWQLASVLAPDQYTIYYSLYELYEKMSMYLDAFKAYSMYIYCKSINDKEENEDIEDDLNDAFSPVALSVGTIEQYQKCGRLLEKCNCYTHALLAYYQCHILHMKQYEQEMKQKQDEKEYAARRLKHKKAVTDELLDEYKNLEEIEKNEVKSLERKYHYLIYIQRKILPQILTQQQNMELALSERENELIQQIITIVQNLSDLKIE